MITKENFIKFITNYQHLDKRLEEVDKTITGKSYACFIYETDFYDNVGHMIDAFLESHFTEAGCDLVSWFVFEDIEHIIYQEVEPNIFGEKEIKYVLNSLDDLWNYMNKYKDEYFK